MTHDSELLWPPSGTHAQAGSSSLVNACLGFPTARCTVAFRHGGPRQGPECLKPLNPTRNALPLGRRMNLLVVTVIFIPVHLTSGLLLSLFPETRQFQNLNHGPFNLKIARPPQAV